MTNKTNLPYLENIGRAMSSEEQRIYWTHSIDFVEPHEAEEFVRAQRLEEKGYSLVGSRFDNTPSLTRDIVIPGERVLTLSEIEELSKKFTRNKTDKFSRIIQSAYTYSFLSE